MRWILTLAIAIDASAGYLPGWTTLSSTQMHSVSPADGYGGAVCPTTATAVCPSGTSALFSAYSSAVISAWGGGVLDPLHNQLLVMGGGHDDYFGNEIYSLGSLSTTPAWNLFTNPSTTFLGTSGSPGVNVDGTPPSRHTYGGLTALGNTGKFLMFAGSQFPTGNTLIDTWIFDTTPKTWTQLSTSGANQPNTLGSTDVFGEPVYDPVTDLVFLAFNGSFWKLNWHTGVYTRLNNSGAVIVYQPTCSLDPNIRTPLGGSAGRWMVCVGTPYLSTTVQVWGIDISGNDATYTPVNWTSTTAGSCANLNDGVNDPITGLPPQGGPGWVYDDALGMFVGLPIQGGNTVYLFSDVTLTCVAVTYPNGPPRTKGSNGFFGRWQYVKNGNYLIAVSSATANVTVLNLDSQIQGLGRISYTCVDKDGDGYGTGAGCTGPDADDENAAVHTTAQAISAYGTLDATYQRRGYHPTRYWTLDAVSGNDGTGASCTPANFGGGGGSDCKAFQHWTALSGSVTPGDLVALRGVTFNYPLVGVSGSAGAYVHVVAYPGELPLFSGYPNQLNFIDKSWWIIDGIKIDLLGDTTAGFGAIQGGTTDSNSSSTFHDWIVRNVEAANATNGVYVFNGLQNGLLENNSFHDMTTSHAIYMGSRAMVSSNVEARRNLLYKNSRCGIQFNGRVSDLRVQQNIAYQNGIIDGGNDYCLENGVHDSFIRANVSLGSAFGITMNTYDGNEWGGTVPSGGCGVSGTAHCTCNPGDTPAGPNQGSICAFSEFNNVFANNTTVNTGFDINGADISGNPLYQIGRQATVCTTATCLATSFPNNVYQNMVILSKGQSTYAPPFTFTTGSTAPTSGPSNTVNGVVYLQTTGNVGFLGYGLQSGCCGYNGYTAAAAVTAGYIASATNVINSNPQFAALGAYNNIAGYDLRLQSSSPALNTGTALVGNLPMDILGNFLSATAPSMGAFEQVSGGGSSFGGKAAFGGKVQ